jgi:uncharacterized protein
VTSAPALRLLTGKTVHARFTPFEQRFSYRLVMVDVDVDRLDEAARLTRLFSVDQSNLYSLNRAEHGGGATHTSLRGWATQRLAEAGVDAGPFALRLVTFPRHLFYRFAPLSIWFCETGDGALQGVIYEVNNTFGERHAYVAPVRGNSDISEADKRFHVSPFFDITGRYRFTLKRSLERLSLVIDTLVDGQRTHMATIAARARPATDRALLGTAITHPFSSIGVTLGIHWEALKIWLKGAGYRPKPNTPDVEHTIAEPGNKLSTRTTQ